MRLAGLARAFKKVNAKKEGEYRVQRGNERSS